MVTVNEAPVPSRRQPVYDVVAIDFDVVPSRTRQARYEVRDRFVVLVSLTPAPTSNDPEWSFVGRVWPASGSCTIVERGGSPQVTRTAYVVSGKVSSLADTKAPSA